MTSAFISASALFNYPLSEQAIVMPNGAKGFIQDGTIEVEMDFEYSAHGGPASHAGLQAFGGTAKIYFDDIDDTLTIDLPAGHPVVAQVMKQQHDEIVDYGMDPDHG